MAANKDNFCVIMGGGIGSRFWPVSRKTLPKQFLDFFGTGRSLLQQTFDRFKKIIPVENILIVTNAMYADLVREQLPELLPEQILLEPTRRNTAPCIAWASYHIRAKHPNANVVVAPSDHLILKEEEFLTAIEKGLVYLGISAGSMIAAGNFADSLGYLANPLIPHAEKGSPCGEISKGGLIELADGQTVLIKGECQEIIC